MLVLFWILQVELFILVNVPDVLTKPGCLQFSGYIYLLLL